jgi:hypothetical protein
MALDEKPKLDTNDATKAVAAFLNSYAFWTDGYSESAAEEWDGRVKLYGKETSELRSAIFAMQRVIKSGNDSNEMKALDLKGDGDQYLDMLSHMISCV